METMRKAIQAGTFEMALPQCELRQRGTDTPIVFTGPGLVSQTADRRLVVRVFAPPVKDFVETFNRSFNQDFVPGKLTPETEYYDLVATDMYGASWTAERVRLDTNHSFNGTYIQVDPNRLESTRERDGISARASLVTFVPGALDLPWHSRTTSGDHDMVNHFESSADHYAWTVRRTDDGVFLTVNVQNRLVEPVFTEFWRALSILTGRALHTEVFEITERKSYTKRIANGYWDNDDARLLVPIQLKHGEAQHAHAFISAYLRQALNNDDERPSCSGLIFQHWHRILRARENDIENSALVLSVAIEGIINDAITSVVDEDEVFVDQIDGAKQAIKGLKGTIGDRAWNWMLSNLGNATKPRAKHVLQRLVEQGVITSTHVKAWTDMRNDSAHGGVLPDNSAAFQEHIDGFHICLDLFYRLVFLIIGYRGEYRDYSAYGWPDAVFPPPPPSSP